MFQFYMHTLKQNWTIITNTNKDENYIESLTKLAEAKNLTAIDVQTIFENGLSSSKDRIKILGGGTLSAKLEVKANAFSKSAKEAIEKILEIPLLQNKNFKTYFLIGLDQWIEYW